MITQESIQNLKNHLDIVDTITNYIELKKSGANFKGLCPFHGEQTPSLVVSPQKQIFHCFGCHVGGDSIKFVMEYEKISYPEAIEHLARANNFTLEYEQGEKRKDSSKILEQVKDFYKEQLDKNETSLKYLHERGVHTSSIEEFEIGFAPSSQATLDFLKRNFLPFDEAIEVGVIGESNALYARFIDRIIFPIYTQNGAVTGFGGRTITGHQAKYVNSPQSKVFNKSKLLYGYHKAKETIYKKSEIIITEGYLDVIMLHQAGFKNATATLGTALTTDHLPLLKKGEPRVILAYDGDSAGLSAAYKASILMATGSFDGGVVIFKDGQDPADMVKSGQIQELSKLFSNPQPFVEYIIDHMVSDYDLNNPNQKQKALQQIKDFLQTLPQIIANEYREYVAGKLKIETKFISINQRHSYTPTQTQNKIDTAEAQIIKTVASRPALLDELINLTEPFMFVHHNEEYKLALIEDFENPLILSIVFNEEIKEISDDEFFGQLKMFSINSLQNMLKDVTRDNSINFEEKNKKIRELREKINRLKTGKLL